MATYVADIETDGLLNNVTKIFQLSLLNVETHEITSYYTEEALIKGLALLQSADRYIFHNGLGYDIVVINKLYPQFALSYDKCIDTLVLSRLIFPENPRHSLQYWGTQLGEEKLEHKDFSQWSEEMKEYCERDVSVTFKLYKHLSHFIPAKFSQKSVDIEHQFSMVVHRAMRDGFYVNKNKMIELREAYIKELHTVSKDINNFVPPYIKKEQLKTKVKETIVTFNPGSSKQRYEKLIELGWKPTEFTETGLPKAGEKEISTFTHPLAQLLCRYLRLSKQITQIEPINKDGGGWLNSIDKDGRIRPFFNHNGTVTHRMTCSSPNLQNVDKKDLDMRAVWCVPMGKVLVGMDASSLELRCLAHYLYKYDGGKYIKQVLYGDIHESNRIAMGLESRAQAKTAMYGMLYGIGAERLGRDLKRMGIVSDLSDLKLGQDIKRKLIENIDGLQELLNSLARKASSGFITCIDGRLARIRADYVALNTLLQSCGAIIMKIAAISLSNAIEQHGLYPDVKWCALVHDEFQLEVPKSKGDLIGKLGIESMNSVQEKLGLKVPIDGDYKIGYNWKDTH